MSHVNFLFSFLPQSSSDDEHFSKEKFHDGEKIAWDRANGTGSEEKKTQLNNIRRESFSFK